MCKKCKTNAKIITELPIRLQNKGEKCNKKEYICIKKGDEWRI